jgi:formate-dependent nitrite reductase membrane component NrfD
MPKVSLAFFTMAPVYLLIGMAGGIFMAISEDHALAPAHAHLNLIGFAVMSVMGTFFALAKDQAGAKLPWVVFWLLNLGLIMMIPSLALVISGSKNPGVTAVLAASQFVAVGAVLTYFVCVLGAWKDKA